MLPVEIFLPEILIFKGLIARRLYRFFGVLGVNVNVSPAFLWSSLGRCLVTSPFSSSPRPSKCIQKQINENRKGEVLIYLGQLHHTDELVY
jgi:hypothetical protein